MYLFFVVCTYSYCTHLDTHKKKYIKFKSHDFFVIFIYIYFFVYIMYSILCSRNKPTNSYSWFWSVCFNNTMSGEANVKEHNDFIPSCLWVFIGKKSYCCHSIRWRYWPLHIFMQTSMPVKALHRPGVVIERRFFFYFFPCENQKKQTTVPKPHGAHNGADHNEPDHLPP